MMLADTIVRESRGSPYFVYELVEYLREGGDLAEGSTNSSDISLDNVLARRISKLPEEANRLLEVVALAGQPLRQSVACKAAGLGASGYAGLTELRSQHLVRGTGTGIARRGRDLPRPDPGNRGQHADGRPAAASCMGVWRGTWRRPAGRMPRRWPCISRGPVTWRRRAATMASRPTRRARRWPLIGRSSSIVTRLILVPATWRPSGGCFAPWRTPWQTSVGASRRPCLPEGAVDADQSEQTELQRRAAYQFLASGHIDEGLVGLRRDPRSVRAEPAKNSAKGTVSPAIQPGSPCRPRPGIQGASGRPNLPAQARAGRHIPVPGPGHQYRRRDPGRRLPNPELPPGPGSRRAAADRDWRWDGRPCMCPARGGQAGDGRSAWFGRRRSLANRIGHPHALGMASLSAGSAEFLVGRYQPGIEFLNKAEAIFRDRCTGVVWELDTTRIYILWSLFYVGRLAELRDRCDELFHEATSVTTGIWSPPPARSWGHSPARRRRRRGSPPLRPRGTGTLVASRLSHPASEFLLWQPLYRLVRRRCRRAWRRIKETERVLESSLLLRIQQVNTDVIQHNGRCAVAMAAVSGEPEPFLRQAEKSGASPRATADRLGHRAVAADQSRAWPRFAAITAVPGGTWPTRRAIGVGRHGPLRRLGEAAARSTAREETRAAGSSNSPTAGCEPSRSAIPPGWLRAWRPVLRQIDLIAMRHVATGGCQFSLSIG